MAVNRSDDERRAADEARIAQLYALASVEEPPARLDAGIAAAARRTAAPPSRRQSAPWWQMWRVPFAVAAVAVVSVSLVTLMREEGGERLTRAPESAPPVVVEQDAARSDRQESTAPPAAAPGAKKSELAREQGSQSTELKLKKVAPPADRNDDTASAGPARREAAAPNEGQRDAAENRVRSLQKAPMSEAPQAIAQQRAGGSVAGALSSPRALPDSQAPEAFPAAADRAMRAPAPAAKPAAPVVAQPPAPVAQSAATAGRSAAPAASPASGPRGLASEVAGFDRPSPEVARHIVQLDNQPPSAWIGRISALRQEGRLTESDGLLAEFKRRFPQEPIPLSLQ